MAKNTPIIKDWFLLGFTSGVAASIAKTLTNFALNKAGVPTTHFGSMASAMILGKKGRLGGLLPPPELTKSEWVLGYVADALFGGLLGAGLAYVYVKTPPGNEFAKGAVGGAGLWAGTMALGKQLKLARLAQAQAPEMMTLLGSSVLFGGLQGLVIGKYGASAIEQSHPVLVKHVSSREFGAGRTETQLPAPAWPERALGTESRG